MDNKKQPFMVYVRREPGYELRVTVRFEMREGHGIIHLRRGGEEPSPSALGEEVEVDVDLLRGGRFIHVTKDTGRRMSYAFSRISADMLQRLPDDKLVELDAITEYGFRYLVLPELEETAEEPVASAAVSVPVTPRPEIPEMANSMPPTSSIPPRRNVDVTRVPKRSSPTATLPPVPREVTTEARNSLPGAATSLPPRPVAMEASLANRALAELDRDGAVRRLKVEMEKVAVLLARVEVLERAVEDSRGRERDLLDVLRKWHDRNVKSQGS